MAEEGMDTEAADGAGTALESLTIDGDWASGGGIELLVDDDAALVAAELVVVNSEETKVLSLTIDEYDAVLAIGDGTEVEEEGEVEDAFVGVPTLEFLALGNKK